MFLNAIHRGEAKSFIAVFIIFAMVMSPLSVFAESSVIVETAGVSYSDSGSIGSTEIFSAESGPEIETKNSIGSNILATDLSVFADSSLPATSDDHGSSIMASGDTAVDGLMKGAAETEPSTSLESGNAGDTLDDPGVQTDSAGPDHSPAVAEAVSEQQQELESPAGQEAASEGNSYFATITPDGLVDGVDTGSPKTFTITFTELSYATKLGSARVEIPAGFTPGTFVGITSVSGGKDWAGELSLSGLFVYLWALNEASYLVGGESVSATFTATAPGNRGIYTFQTAAWTDAAPGFDGVGSNPNNMATGYRQPWVIVGEGVSTPAELIAVRNNLAGFYVQTDHINLTGINWNPIGTSGAVNNRFRGAYSGNGYTISNLTITGNKDNVGLFGVTHGATIKSVTLENVSVTGRNRVGALVGWNRAGSIIDNSHVNRGSVTGLGFRVGGLVGHNDGEAGMNFITSSSSAAAVTGAGKNHNHVGGLVGNNRYSIISNSYATGNVTGAYNVGGLIGLNISSIINTSYATGIVTGVERVGGLIGRGDAGTVVNESFATGSVTGTGNAATQQGVGGLVGFITGSGGRSPNPSTISNSYANGTVSGTNNVGGLVGRLQGRTTINSTYAAGFVSKTGTTGGLVGSKTALPTVTNSFYDSDTTGQSDTGKGVPLTTVQMRQIASFLPAWSISAVDGTGTTWRIYEGSTYPLLSWPMQQSRITAVKTYDGTNLIAAGDFSPAVNIPGLTVTGTFNNPNAGSDKPVTLVFLSADSTLELSKKLQWYDFLSTGTINRAPLTITANDDSKTYDAIAYSGGNGVVYLGFVGGEDETVLGGTLAYSGTSQGVVNVGSSVITPEGLTSGNYIISFVDGALTITRAPLTITADSFSKVRGSILLFNGTEFTASGLVGIDRVDSTTITSAGSPATAAVGIYPMIISDATGSGLDNYDIMYVDGQLTVVAITPDSGFSAHNLIVLPELPVDRALTIIGGTNAYITHAFIINGSRSELVEATNAYFKKLQQYEAEKERLSAELVALYETEFAIARAALLAREADLAAKSNQPYNIIALREAYRAAQVTLQANRNRQSAGQAATADLLMESIAEVIGNLS